MGFDIVRVGVAVIVSEEETGKVLVGRRKGNVPGTGKLQFPGGHLEPGEESFDACAIRETLEETGIKVIETRFLGAINVLFHDVGKHYVTIFMGATAPRGSIPQLCEPDKCEFWEWWTPKQMLHDTKDDQIFSTIGIFRKQFPAVVDDICRRHTE